MLPKELGGVVNVNLQVHGTGELSFGSSQMKVEVRLTMYESPTCRSTHSSLPLMYVG